MTLSVDIFCRVVDNYGDIGVCWRLARQLSSEQDIAVRLIVDDLATFKKIAAAIDVSAPKQNIDGIEIMHWNDAVLLQNYTTPADAVIEAFACTLSPLVIGLMRETKPVWLDFEYLSAEDWIDDCHAIPSFHPETGLLKTLFFPGFTEKSGGLLRERNLVAERIAFQSDIAAQNTWRSTHGLPAKQAGVLDASLFCYPDAPAASLHNARLFVPEGVMPDLKGAHVHRFKFLSSTDYDRLLWTCDLNFVRGEDSWIRAIWAARPFIWQIYKQDEDAHLLKLSAFLNRYNKGLPQNGRESLANFHAMWNERGRDDKKDPFGSLDCLSLTTQISAHAQSWSDDQAGMEDCASRMVGFIRTQIENKHQTTG